MGQKQDAPTGSQGQQKSGGGCTWIMLSVLGALLALLFVIRECDKSLSPVARDDRRTASESTASGPAHPPLDAAVEAAPPTGSAHAARTRFDDLWEHASVPDPRQSFDALFSLYMSKADFCSAYGCGDEFTRDAKWATARERAKALQATTWRETIPVERSGFLSSRDGFQIGEYAPARREFPISVEWPRALGGAEQVGGPQGERRTPCAPRRPGVTRNALDQAHAGDALNLWDSFKSTPFSVGFDDAEQARAWKTDPDNRSVLRFVFRLTGAAVDSQKQTVAGVTIDSGAGGLALIQVLGYRLEDDAGVLAERVDSK